MPTLEALVTAYRPFEITDYEVDTERACLNENACIPPGLSCASYCRSCHYTPSGCRRCPNGGGCNWGTCICNAPCYAC